MTLLKTVAGTCAAAFGFTATAQAGLVQFDFEATATGSNPFGTTAAMTVVFDDTAPAIGTLGAATDFAPSALVSMVLTVDGDTLSFDPAQASGNVSVSQSEFFLPISEALEFEILPDALNGTISGLSPILRFNLSQRGDGSFFSSIDYDGDLLFDDVGALLSGILLEEDVNRDNFARVAGANVITLVGNGIGANFSITSVMVSDGADPVPVPAAAALFVPGLAGMWLARRRRKA